MSTTFTATGVTYEHCEQRIAGVLTGVDGVEDTTADREAERATVEGGADTDALIATVEDAGCDASA